MFIFQAVFIENFDYYSMNSTTNKLREKLFNFVMNVAVIVFRINLIGIVLLEIKWSLLSNVIGSFVFAVEFLQTTEHMYVRRKQMEKLFRVKFRYLLNLSKKKVVGGNITLRKFIPKIFDMQKFVI